MRIWRQVDQFVQGPNAIAVRGASFPKDAKNLATVGYGTGIALDKVD
jgi:hypothetical protein